MVKEYVLILSVGKKFQKAGSIAHLNVAMYVRFLNETQEKRINYSSIKKNMALAFQKEGV